MPASIISELETALQSGPPEKRRETLHRVTDLFLVDNSRLKDEQIALFDAVLGCLIQSIETEALAALSKRLAPVDNAPPRIIGNLARNDEIAVAGPVLTQSRLLSTADLVEIASTKSQAHMLAISSRHEIEEAVTDVLVQRGNNQVVGRLAHNAGAAFSQEGFVTMTRRVGSNQNMLQGLAQRADLPVHLFRELVQQATDDVRHRLYTRVTPERRVEIERLTAKVAADVERDAGVGRAREAAERQVQHLQENGRLDIGALRHFASADKFEEMRATASVLCGVPGAMIDQLTRSKKIDGLLILFKAAGFDQGTVMSVLQMPSFPRPLSELDREQAGVEYQKLTAATAQRVVRFWKVRASAVNSSSQGHVA